MNYPLNNLLIIVNDTKVTFSMVVSTRKFIGNTLVPSAVNFFKLIEYLCLFVCLFVFCLSFYAFLVCLPLYLPLLAALLSIYGFDQQG